MFDKVLCDLKTEGKMTAEEEKEIKKRQAMSHEELLSQYGINTSSTRK
jgi:hypothetical protein